MFIDGCGTMRTTVVWCSSTFIYPQKFQWLLNRTWKWKSHHRLLVFLSGWSIPEFLSSHQNLYGYCCIMGTISNLMDKCFHSWRRKSGNDQILWLLSAHFLFCLFITSAGQIINNTTTPGILLLDNNNSTSPTTRESREIQCLPIRHAYGIKGIDGIQVPRRAIAGKTNLAWRILSSFHFILDLSIYIFPFDSMMNLRRFLACVGLRRKPRSLPRVQDKYMNRCMVFVLYLCKYVFWRSKKNAPGFVNNVLYSALVGADELRFLSTFI